MVNTCICGGGGLIHVYVEGGGLIHVYVEGGG